jgi:hypothetical protein
MGAAPLQPETSKAEPVVRGQRSLLSAEKLGLDPQTCTAEGCNPKALYEGERFASLAQKERYFRGQQHDHKVFDFYQRLQKAPSGVQPLMGGVMSSSYIALTDRRPAAPVRLARKITKGFTQFVFGRGRWPAIKVVGDTATQSFAEALVRASRMPNVLLRARNLGGSCGTVGLSWRYWEGSPRVQVHNARCVIVHRWADREQLVPAHVSEITQYAQDVWNKKDKCIEKRMFYRRRDWTEQADIAFLDVPEGDEPEWTIDDSDDATYVHGDGFCHFVWVQNLPDLDGSCEDGEADLEGLFDNCDMADVIASTLAVGGSQNLDPTLVMSVDKDKIGRDLSKGSDNAPALGQGGTAQYLTLPADLINAGKELLTVELKKAETTAGYIEPDPDKIAAAGTSGKALELLYGPMVAVCDTLREQYGLAIERLLEQMIASAKRRMSAAGEDGELSYSVLVGDVEEEGVELTEEEVDFVLDLPPLVTEEDVVGEDGQPTGERRVVVTEVHPGQGGDVELAWGPYFPPTAADLQARATALGAAAGGKAILPQRTAVELFAVELGRDPAVEWSRMVEQLAAERAAQSGMFPDAGMPVPPELQEQNVPPPEDGTGAPKGDAGTDAALSLSPAE